MIDNGTSEVDLKKTFQQILYWFFHRMKALMVFLITAMILSALFFIFQKNKFYLSYTISSDFMSGQKIEIIYDDVKKMISVKETGRLAKLLNLPEKNIKNIVGFKVTVEEPFLNIQSDNVKPDFHFNETNTSIKITLTDSSEAFQLVDALNHFVSTSNYFQKIKRNELISMQKINDNLEKEKKELDSIHEINLKKFSQSNGNMILLNDLSQIKQNTYIIQERLINNQRGIERIETPINVINHPILQKQSILMGLLVAAGKGFAVVTALFTLLLIFLKARNAYRTFKRKS